MGIVRMENAQAGNVISVEERFDRSGRAPVGAANDRPALKEDSELSDKVAAVLTRFTQWLESYGETSWDHQSFFAVMERLVLPRSLPSSFAKRSCRGRAVSFIIEFVFRSLMRIMQWVFYSSTRPAGSPAASKRPLIFSMS